MSQELEQQLQQWVPAAVAGDKAALQKIITLTHPFIVRYVRARIGAAHHVTADDVIQETFLALSTSITSYVERGRPFMAFMYGIASNKVADARRSFVRDRSLPTEDVPEQVATDLNPEDNAVILDGCNRVEALLDSLSSRAREIVVLRVFVGLSAEETAQIVGTTPGAIRVAQHRALATLRKAVESN